MAAVGASDAPAKAMGKSVFILQTPFFQFLPEIRNVIYTTHAIESLNMVMRKYTRNRRISPNDDLALKALFLAIQQVSKNWKAIHHWKPALQSFQIMFGEDRVPLASQ